MDFGGLDSFRGQSGGLQGIPQSEEAEQSVLGACLVDPRCLPDVLATLREDDFYSGKHRAIYGALSTLSKAGHPVDTITVTDVLRQAGTLDLAGGVAYLAELVSIVPHAAHVTQYGKAVRVARQRRDLLRLGHDLAQAAMTEPDVDALLERTERELFAINAAATVGGYVTLSKALQDTVADLSASEAHPGNVGIPSGFPTLDHFTGGWQRTDLVIVAARPSMGKTAFAVQAGCHAAKRGLGVALVSLEMGTAQLVKRMLAAEGEINAQHLRLGNLNREDWSKVANASNAIESLPLAINDSPGQTLLVMRSQLRQLASHMPLALVVVDYMQLIPSQGGARNREQEVSEASRSLKLLAKELNVCVMALAQLNRECERRPDKRPLLSDIRESGSIEQDADLVLALYRDEVYHDDTDKPGIAEVIVRKHRNGPTGFVELAWAEQWTRFSERGS